jgi:DNA polymerase-1
MPDGLAVQWAKAPGLYEALGWKVLDHSGLEADDLMHSLALAEERAGGKALIFTGDRDMFQCATENVHVLLQQARKGFTEMGPDEVREWYGIGPEQVPDFIALRGDPSTGCRAPRASAPRRRRTSSSARATSSTRSSARSARSRRCGAR